MRTAWSCVLTPCPHRTPTRPHPGLLAFSVLFLLALFFLALSLLRKQASLSWNLPPAGLDLLLGPMFPVVQEVWRPGQGLVRGRLPVGAVLLE